MALISVSTGRQATRPRTKDLSPLRTINPAANSSLPMYTQAIPLDLYYNMTESGQTQCRLSLTSNFKATSISPPQPGDKCAAQQLLSRVTTAFATPTATIQPHRSSKRIESRNLTVPSNDKLASQGFSAFNSAQWYGNEPQATNCPRLPQCQRCHNVHTNGEDLKVVVK